MRSLRSRTMGQKIHRRGAEAQRRKKTTDQKR